MPEKMAAFMSSVGNAFPHLIQEEDVKVPCDSTRYPGGIPATITKLLMKRKREKPVVVPSTHEKKYEHRGEAELRTTCDTNLIKSNGKR